MQYSDFDYNNATYAYKLICKQIHKHFSQQSYMRHNTFAMYTFDTIFNVETQSRKTIKTLFIWHEKYMAPFCLCTMLETLIQILFSYLYILSYLLMLSGILLLVLLYLTLLLIFTRLDQLLFSILLRTQQQPIRLFLQTQNN